METGKEVRRVLHYAIDVLPITLEAIDETFENEDINRS